MLEGQLRRESRDHQAARLEPGAGLVAVTGETGTGKTSSWVLSASSAATLQGPTALDLTATQRRRRGGSPLVRPRPSWRRVLLARESPRLPRRIDGPPPRRWLRDSARSSRSWRNTNAKRFGREFGEETRRQDARRCRAGARDVYQAAWGRLTALRADNEALGGDTRALAGELDLARHQAAEISAARLQPGEEESLKAALARLRHVGEITEGPRVRDRNLEDEGGAKRHCAPHSVMSTPPSVLTIRWRPQLPGSDGADRSRRPRARSPPRHRLDRPRPIRTCGSRRNAPQFSWL